VRSRPQDLLHLLAFREFVDQLVQIPDFLQQRIVAGPFASLPGLVRGADTRNLLRYRRAGSEYLRKTSDCDHKSLSSEKRTAAHGSNFLSHVGQRVSAASSECNVYSAESGETNMGKPRIPTITAFEASPDQGQGLARDMRVRWALEEVGQSYNVRLLSFGEMKESAHLKLHPFGQIPTYEEGELVLFESGAIVFHIAQRHAGLLPVEANARARATAWIFAALNTVEPPIVELEQAQLVETDKPWYAERLPMLEDRIRVRLDQLTLRLGTAEWLDDAFSAGDLTMVMVLRRVNGEMLEDYPSLCAYVARGESRPAYKRAFADQLAVFTESQES
jgi:glutathione S-transferase